MANVMRALTASISAVFGTIETTANTVSNTLTAVSGGSDMLNSYVLEAKTNQQNRIKIDSDTALETMIKDASADQAKHSKAIVDEVTRLGIGDEFTANYKRLKALFPKEETKA
jgi:hypothetical protein